MPKLSVVVPVYNAAQYLDQLILSLRQQTLKDLQIILVDDGSPDDRGQICDRHAAEDDRILVIHKPNGGVGAARNDGRSFVACWSQRHGACPTASSTGRPRRASHRPGS